MIFLLFVRFFKILALSRSHISPLCPKGLAAEPSALATADSTGPFLKRILKGYFLFKTSCQVLSFQPVVISAFVWLFLEGNLCHNLRRLF